MSVFTKRLKQERKRAGLSQEKLGVLAGIDETTASARMNQYEKGKYQPYPNTVEKIAEVLGVPVALFYEDDDEIAEVLRLMHRMAPEHRLEVLDFIRAKVGALEDGCCKHH